jgi:S-adenosylmethionine:tRNA ribosyltransferase-isomerase
LYDKDKERYQTIYAKERGSVAAPTAGLHFSQDLLKKIKDKGVKTFELTLHVGLGTFAHVETAEVEDHKIHQEFYSISRESYDSLSELKKSGHRIVSVGTTTTRVLETIFSNPLLVDDEQSTTLSGWTDIYIYPGYKFKFVDSLITNFHLPSSSLLFLVAALVGKENILNAYEEAIKEKYRFYSYGDAMFID